MVTLDIRDLYLKDLTMYGATGWAAPVFTNIIRYIEAGEIKPLLAKTYPLKEIATAQADFMEKNHIGNLVLLPPETGA